MAACSRAGDDIERVVPGDRLEAAAALFADAAQRLHQALGMVHALGVARDFGADDAVRIRLLRAVDTSDALGCPELNFQRADAGGNRADKRCARCLPCGCL